MPVADPLSKTHPELAAQWHPTRNEGLTPEDVRANSYKKVWWHCAKGHEWDTPVNKRTRSNYGCPYCSGQRTAVEDSLAARFPGIAAEWHPTLNTLLPTEVRPGSSRKVWWQCPKNLDHVWETPVTRRTALRSGCPKCSGRQRTTENSFAARFPELAAEWHPTKNGESKPSDFAANSTETVWWQCHGNPPHEWKCQIRSRTAHPSVGCRTCARLSNAQTERGTLAESHPEIAAEWDRELNAPLTPHDVKANDHRKVYWRCSKFFDHVWQSTVRNRAILGNGCRYCSGQAASPQNSLGALRPDLAAQWHPTKNGDLTPDKVTLGSDKIVWWVCPINSAHSWQAKIQPRVMHGRGCPDCGRGGRENSLAKRFPEIAAEWDTSRNKDAPNSISDDREDWRGGVAQRIRLTYGGLSSRIGLLTTVAARNAGLDGHWRRSARSSMD